MSATLKQSVIIENKAGGAVGVDTVAASPTDTRSG
jgi:hypothetical protein